MPLMNANAISAVAIPAVEKPAPRAQINVVLFSGGSGTRSITDAFRRHPQISLKILINAYDDGHSTGRLRRFFARHSIADVLRDLCRPNGDRLIANYCPDHCCPQAAIDCVIPFEICCTRVVMRSVALTRNSHEKRNEQ